MPTYRSKTSTAGRNMAGARSLWRATGMKDDDFSKPIIAIANSFTQFVPGHVHLKDLGQLVAREIEAAGGVAYRGSFLIDQNGVVRHMVVNDLPLGRNIDEMLRMVDALQFTEEHGEVCPAGWNKGKAGMKASTSGVAEYLAKNQDKL